MKIGMKAILSIIAACLLLTTLSVSAAQEYEAFGRVKKAKAIFDVRIGNPASAAIHLKLMHQTYKDLTTAKKKPVFKIVFIGPSVKLISKNREGFALEDQKSLDEIANTVSEMSKDGIKLEICMTAANLFNVDAASVLPEIEQHENGWISLIGYQANGYALVPAY